MSGEKPVPAVGTVCFRGEDVLLIRRGTKPLAGNWSIPGGKIEFGERAEAAALRELKEETGVTAHLVGLIDVVDAIFTSRTSGEPTRHYVLFDFAAVWDAGEPVAGDDAAHAEWIGPERLESLELWDETRRIIAAARAMLASQSAS
ncbi:MAG: NUDIX hydrolase [Hyphomonas sp.]|uniref:NUDIX hydrolase n=1 Tax=Hyphomonas sp. TaxID=87 RepID=UPI00352806B0